MTTNTVPTHQQPHMRIRSADHTGPNNRGLLMQVKRTWRRSIRGMYRSLRRSGMTPNMARLVCIGMAATFGDAVPMETCNPGYIEAGWAK